MTHVSALLIAALLAVESGVNDKAVGDHGRSVGCLQISSAVVADVNAHLPRGMMPFTLSDRLDRQRSISIMLAYWCIYATPQRLGHEPSEQDLARIWNGGPDGWRKRSTLQYWRKVQKLLPPE